MLKKLLVLSTILLLGFLIYKKFYPVNNISLFSPSQTSQNNLQNPLSIDEMRKKSYPGSDLEIVQTLSDWSNYHQYIASYNSDGLKIYGLLTVPIGEKPTSGWPVIIFNHGYIPPAQYRTTERYVSYVDGFARNGYIVFKSDYRGNGLSEGQPEGAYYSPAYTTDILNAIASIKKLRDPETSSGRFVVDTNRIGMWGHSLGGNITLRSLVVDPIDIKAAVIWGGVVGPYDNLMNNWRRRVPFTPSPQEIAARNRTRANLIEKYGSPSANPKFWNSIDPNYYLERVSAPVQLHSGLADEEVPWQFSQGLKDR